MAIKTIDETSKELIARIEREAGKVSVSVKLDGREHHVWFAVSGADPGREPDFLLPLTLFPAMASGSRLRLPGGVSPRLLAAVPKIQEIFRLWATEYWGGMLQGVQCIPVDAEVRDGRGENASGVACLFSGGVDSFYTLLKHCDEITHIIFVHGIDIALENQALRAQSSRMAREVAKGLGKSLIEVETNLRPFSRKLVGWQEHHGAALASVALLFQRRFRKVLIAATYSYAELLPIGSHPMLDPLWSTELTEIEHDGCEATRVEKTAYISEHELAMQWLRVCPGRFAPKLVNPDGAYNCGRCEKCLRTMIALRITGALERCKTLPSYLDLEQVANLYIPGNRLVTRQNLRALERLGTEPELARALEKSLAASEKAGPNRDYLQRELSLAHKELEQTRAKLEASKKRAQRLKARRERLAEHNRLLTARYSARRYTFADAVVSMVLRVPKIGKLVRRGRTAENR